MWLLTAIFFCYEYLLQVSPGIMATDLRQSFNINAASLGVMAAIYFYAYTAMQIPCGVLIDYFGARKLIAASACCCATGAILFGSSNIFILALAGRLLMGLGSASAYIGSAYVAATWLPKNRFTMLNGFIVTIGMLGAMGGQAPLALMVAKLKWQPTMLLLGAIGLALAALIWLVVRDKKHHNEPQNFTQVEKKLLHGLRYIIHSKQTWLAAIYGGLMFTPTILFGAIWGVPFLTAKYQMSTTTAATLVAMLFLGWAVGSPLFGAWSDRIKRRKIFIIISVLGALLFFCGLIYIPHLPRLVIALFLFAAGFFSSAFIVAFSIAREINPSFAVGAAMGFMNAVNMIGGAILPPIIGLLLDHTNFNYTISLSSIPIILILALIIGLQIQETYAKLKFNHD